MARVMIVMGFVGVIMLAGFVFFYTGVFYTSEGEDEGGDSRTGVEASSYIGVEHVNEEGTGGRDVVSSFSGGNEDKGIEDSEDGIEEDQSEAVQESGGSYVDKDKGFSLEGSSSTSYDASGGSGQDLSSWVNSDSSVTEKELDSTDFDSIRESASSGKPDGRSSFLNQVKHLLSDSNVDEAVANSGMVVVDDGDIGFMKSDSENVLYVQRSTSDNYRLAGEMLVAQGVAGDVSGVVQAINDVLDDGDGKITRDGLSYGRIGYGVRIEW